MNDETTLLPCPFCGGEASKRLFYKGKYRVHCNGCDAHSGDVCDTEAEAIAAWNTRAELGSGTCHADDNELDYEEAYKRTRGYLDEARKRIAELEAEVERLRKAGYEHGWHDAMKAVKR